VARGGGKEELPCYFGEIILRQNEEDCGQKKPSKWGFIWVRRKCSIKVPGSQKTKMIENESGVFQERIVEGVEGGIVRKKRHPVEGRKTEMDKGVLFVAELSRSKNAKLEPKI